MKKKTFLADHCGVHLKLCYLHCALLAIGAPFKGTEFNDLGDNQRDRAEIILQ